MAKSVITDSLFENALKLINEKNYSVRAACAELNIPRTSFRRMVSNKGGIKLENDIEYFVLLKSSSYTFIINDSFYTIDIGSAEHNKKLELIESLVNRKTFKMKLNEQAIIVENNLNKQVRDIIARINDFEVIDGKFFYKKHEITQEFYSILKTAVNKKGDSNITKFADLLIENPDESMIYQLHQFITHNDIAIDDDGFVIAYKSVRFDWYDHHSRKYYNQVGEVIKMDRNDVNSDPNVTCSNGLHVGSLSYINKMYNGTNDRLMICKINPKNFVSIPFDYKCAKARVCEYEVIGEMLG